MISQTGDVAGMVQGVDPGFPWEGTTTRRGGRQHMILENFPKKLHESKNILGRRGRGAHQGRSP